METKKRTVIIITSILAVARINTLVLSMNSGNIAQRQVKIIEVQHVTVIEILSAKSVEQKRQHREHLLLSTNPLKIIVLVLM